MRIIANTLKENKYDNMRIKLDCWDTAGDNVTHCLTGLINALSAQCTKFSLKCKLQNKWTSTSVYD